ncbi:DAK2 domain-containing protein [Chloroflexota bacterium]
MERIDSCSGEMLKGMFVAATRWLEKNAANINSLNVFPVPDGDTGTNMLLTMRATTDEAIRTKEKSATAIANAMAKGALMGARGNSGVILSQIVRGLAFGLKDKDCFNAREFAFALTEASSHAYKGVSNPVEGTILTVIREAAAAAQETALTNGCDLVDVLEKTVGVAKESVARTPTLLDVLREAGVVDAGGQGLYVMLEGVLHYLKSKNGENGLGDDYMVLSAPAVAHVEDEMEYGYCTEFLIKGEDLNTNVIREKLCSMGESVLVVGDEDVVKVHIHTFDPGAILSYAGALGTMHQLKIDNMQDQHQDFIAAKDDGSEAVDGISIVAVVSGEGLSEVFKSIGANIIVPGGQTMNPSVEELLRAVASASTDEVIILPNNPNILLTARQAQSLADKNVAVIGQTIPQGIAALLAFQPDDYLEANVEAMDEAASRVRTAEVTTAVRSTQLMGNRVNQGQTIGFIDGEFIKVSDKRLDVVAALLDHMELEDGSLVTIYWGADSDRAEVDSIVDYLNQKHDGLEIEMVEGKQPHYNYIISVE